MKWNIIVNQDRHRLTAKTTNRQYSPLIQKPTHGKYIQASHSRNPSSQWPSS
nr:MAG TPA: hypothetical protein [Caudoviricetes sp.]